MLDPNIMSTGRRLRELREAAGLSQTALAKAVGVSRNDVSQWESDTTQPSTKRLAAVARALNVPVDQILAPSTQLRERIIDAATRLFDRLGVEETTLDIVAATADVTNGELATLFESKQELLYDVLKAYNDRTFNDMRRIPPKYGDVEARLKQLLRMYYAHDLTHINLTAAMHAYSWQWSEARERENVRQLSDHHETVSEILNDAMDDGEIEPTNSRNASALIFSAYTMSLRKAVFESYDADRLIDHIEPQLRIILKGLGWKGARGGKPDATS